jgi:hypothetical protein
VSLTLTTLRVVGAKLRKDDPRGMKQFIESLQARVAESAAAGAAGGEFTPTMDSNLLPWIPTSSSLCACLLKAVESGPASPRPHRLGVWTRQPAQSTSREGEGA